MGKKGPKAKVSHLPKGAKAVQKTDKKVGEIACPPLGQQKYKPSHSWIQLRIDLKEKPMIYSEVLGDNIPFELWCNMTAYNPKEVDGGASFQALMQHLLTDGKRPVDWESCTAFYTHTMPPKRQKEYSKTGHGNKWVLQGATTRDRYETPVKITVQGTSTDETPTQYYQVAYTAAVQAKHTMRGGDVGGLNNDGSDTQKSNKGFQYTGATQHKQFGDAVPFTPGSKLNWRFAFGVAQQLASAKGGKGSNSSDSSYVSDGISGCMESSGCMSLMNQFAAIYGLYFYDGCDKPENNWVVKTVVDNVAYDVRMRMYNPNYRVEKNSKNNVFLHVDEVLNSYTQSKTDNMLVGDAKFTVPLVFREAEEPLVTRSVICSPKHCKTRVAPFFGGEEVTTRIGKTVRSKLRGMQGSLGALVFKPSAVQTGLYYGFNVSKAHWLYPLYVKDKAEVTGVHLLDGSKRHEAGVGVGFQEWPEWKSEYAHESQHDNKNIFGKIERFADMLQMDRSETLTMEIKRARALGDGRTVTLPNTTETHVTTAGVPTRPDAQIPQATIETTDDAAPPDTMQDSDNVQEQSALIRDENMLDTAYGLGDSALLVADVEDNQEYEGLSKAKELKELYQSPALKEGASQRDKDFNHHFRSSQAQPWPHVDVYGSSSIEYVRKDMDEGKLREYKEKYGSLQNLYLRGETTPAEIAGIINKYGEAKACMKDNIASQSETHLKHMCKILAIYFDTSKIGASYRGNMECKTKRAGMMNGVWIHINGSIMTTIPSKTNKGYTQIWKRVFSKLNHTHVKASDFSMNKLSGHTEASLCVSKVKKLILGKHLASDMTVLEWVTTPWHLAYLPYQSQSSLFKDGETYSEGCKRCSRPFFEFEHMYLWYRQSPDYTQHWPVSYWQDSSKTGWRAPLPFHHPKFWSSGVTLGVKQRKHTRPAAAVEGTTSEIQGADEDESLDGGWQNWPTKLFRIRDSGNLTQEMRTRSNKGEKSYKNAAKVASYLRLNADNYNFTYKQCTSQVWSKQRQAWWKSTMSKTIWSETGYPTYPQGRLTGANAKVRFGHQELHLQRASRYVNVCRDCASDLDLAPGLFHREHRGVFTPGLIIKNPRVQKASGKWWANLIERAQTGGKRINADVLFGMQDPNQSTEAIGKVSDTLDTLIAYINEHHGSMKDSTWTKHKSNSPEIVTQDAIPHLEGSDATETQRSKAIIDLKSLVKMREEADMNKRIKAFKEIDMSNPAFANMLRQLEHKFIHNERFERMPQVAKFDSEVTRLEDRNKTIKGSDGVTYHNCLELTYFDAAPKRVSETVNHVHIERKQKPQVYLCTRTPQGEAKAPTGARSQWAGDRYVTMEGKGADKNRLVSDPAKPLIQWRTLRQSRLFITYSLHRAITDTMVGRHIMEKMTGACYELFGNDANLADILIFGHKLVSSRGSNDMGPDIIGKTTFGIIGNPNKKDSVFYGEQNHTSYVYDTYETHVDNVTIDGGVEIGPQRKHPHFHVLLTVEHWSYVQLDYFRMNLYLELMFKGLDPFSRGWGSQYRLIDGSGGNFYTDNETPYVDIKLYPQDNWEQIIAAYVRKNATPGIFEALGQRNGK